ncbi:MAG: TIGR03862 family flavoprotein [Pseudomonadales bacterium]|nr:TIGR03862 family flavoprotein [Pseudomonadales bacterium]
MAAAKPNATNPRPRPRPRVAIVGAGPAGLAAAEVLCGHADVRVFDARPSAARKFLLAGKSGLNLTHGEPFDAFLARFGAARGRLAAALRALPPTAIRAWSHALGIETFVGSSRRVFPTVMKASPLLRAWLGRLTGAGVTFHFRHRWTGWDGADALVFDTPEGPARFKADATVLALGGASWPRLGSDGAWTDLLAARGVRVHPLRPANCGFDCAWRAPMQERFAGTPVKSVAIGFGHARVRGDFIVTRHGIEGSAVYALSAPLRDALEHAGSVALMVDLLPDTTLERLAQALARPRGKASLATHLRRAAGLAPVKVALLHEAHGRALPRDPLALARQIKSLPLTLLSTRPIAEAISSAGGVDLDELDAHFMLHRLPGTFAAGEMLDWEAPTGGYLLSACLATGRAAGTGAASWLDARAGAQT